MHSGAQAGRESAAASPGSWLRPGSQPLRGPPCSAGPSASCHILHRRFSAAAACAQRMTQSHTVLECFSQRSAQS